MGKKKKKKVAKGGFKGSGPAQQANIEFTFTEIFF